MEARIEKEWVVLKLPACLTLNEKQEILGAFNHYMGEGYVNFIADGSNLTQIDSSAIGLLVKTLKRLHAKGGDLYIRDLRGDTLNFFRQARLDKIFTLQFGDETYWAKEDLFANAVDLKFDLKYEGMREVGIFHLYGRMNLAAARLFKERYLLALADKKKFLLNMKHLTYFDSMGITEIKNLYQILKVSDGEIRVCNANPHIRDVLNLLEIQAHIPMYETQEKALEDWGVPA